MKVGKLQDSILLSRRLKTNRQKKTDLYLQLILSAGKPPPFTGRFPSYVESPVGASRVPPSKTGWKTSAHSLPLSERALLTVCQHFGGLSQYLSTRVTNVVLLLHSDSVYSSIPYAFVEQKSYCTFLNGKTEHEFWIFPKKSGINTNRRRKS